MLCLGLHAGPRDAERLVERAGDWVWFPFWLGLGALFMPERAVTVWKGGWRARLLACAALPELGEAA